MAETFKITFHACDEKDGDKPPKPSGGYIKKQVATFRDLDKACRFAENVLTRACQRGTWKECAEWAKSAGKPGPWFRIEPVK